MPSTESKRPLALLFLLYLSQGLPFGFQATALPVFLRQEGYSLVAVGFSGLLALPWALKLLWAPAIDRFRLPFRGRRTAWIILLQGVMVTAALLTWGASLTGSLPALLSALFLMNLACATQDIAVDALAVDVLQPEDLGYGNAAQVGGYKCGMVMGGGLLMWAAAHLGWAFLFGSLTLLMLLPLPPLLRFREPIATPEVTSRPLNIKGITRQSLRALSRKSLRPFLFFVLFYKTGEAMTDAMFKPFLVDSGFSTATIGLWVGSAGMAASLAGSLAGGLLTRHLGLYRALASALILRLIPLTAIWSLTLTTPSEPMLAVITIGEHLAGGILTTTLFACMMATVEKEVGATHYTALATIEVLGKSPGVWLAGPVAQIFGYAPLFGAGALLSAAVLILLPFVSSGLTRPETLADETVHAEHTAGTIKERS